MIKIALCLVACCIVSDSCLAADIMIRKAPNGYIIMLQTPTGKHCWGMPQKLDLSYIPDKPMDIEAAAARYKWKTPKGKQRQLCEQMKKINWKVHANQDQSTQPVYEVIDGSNEVHNHVTDTVIDRISTNSTCGGYIQNYGISDDLTWRQVTGKNGKQGAALCKEYQ